MAVPDLHLVDDLPPLPIPDGVHIIPARIGVDLTREEWLTLRTSGIGGSDVSAIVGANTWRTGFDVWVDKVAEAVDWVERPRADAFRITWDGVESAWPSEAAFMGWLLEDIVCKRFEATTGYVVVNPEFMLVDDRAGYPRVLNADRLYWDPDLEAWLPFEAKTASAWKADEWDDGPADHAHAQLVHYGLVLDVRHGTAGALIGGQRFVPQPISISDQLANDIEAIEREFWTQHVVPLSPPARMPLDSELGPDVLRIGIENMDAGPAVLAAYDALVQAHYEARAAEDRKKIAAADLKVLLASSTSSPVAFMHNGRKLAGWGAEPTSQRKMYADDQQRFAVDHPDLWANYSREPDDPPVRKLNPIYTHPRGKAIHEALTEAVA
jgi:predicted phage-related endonuclease